MGRFEPGGVSRDAISSTEQPSDANSSTFPSSIGNFGMTGVFLGSRAAARYMLPKRKGSIVNTASIMGLSGGGLYPNVSYQATKGGIVNMTRALAIEWATLR
jgi:NAD(P)-dependent dehydrogenase (short-subunit alcohol dehydrogenase family)